MASVIDNGNYRYGSMNNRLCQEIEDLRGRGDACGNYFSITRTSYLRKHRPYGLSHAVGDIDEHFFTVIDGERSLKFVFYAIFEPDPRDGAIARIRVQDSIAYRNQLTRLWVGRAR
jgi:hypothetical protein